MVVKMYKCCLRDQIFSSLITNKEHCMCINLLRNSVTTWLFEMNSKQPVLIIEESSGASIFVFVTWATTEQFINWLLVLVRITPWVADALKGKNKNLLGTWADGWMLLKRLQSPHIEPPDWGWTNKCLKVNPSPALLHVPYTTSCIASEIISHNTGIRDRLKVNNTLKSSGRTTVFTVVNHTRVIMLCWKIHNTEKPQS